MPQYLCVCARVFWGWVLSNRCELMDHVYGRVARTYPGLFPTAQKLSQPSGRRCAFSSGLACVVHIHG